MGNNTKINPPIPDDFRRHLTMQVLSDGRDERQYKWTDSAVDASWERLMAGLSSAVAEVKQKRYRIETVHPSFSENMRYTDLAMFRELVLDTRLWASVQKTLLKPLDDPDGRLRIYRYPINARHLKTTNVQWFPKSSPPGQTIRINLDNGAEGGSEPINPDNLASIVIGDISLPIRATRRFFLFRPATTIPDAVMRQFQEAYKRTLHSADPADPQQVKYALRTFLQIASIWPNETAMRGPIDLLWHEMILDEIAYAAFCYDETTCGLGQIVNHKPASPQSAYEVKEKYRLTKIRLRAAYVRDSVPFPDGMIWEQIANSAPSGSASVRPGWGSSGMRADSSIQSVGTSASSMPSRSSSADDSFIIATAVSEAFAFSSSGSDSCGYGGDGGSSDCGGGGGDSGGGGGCSC